MEKKAVRLHPRPPRRIALGHAFLVTDLAIFVVGMIFATLILIGVHRLQRDEVASRFAHASELARQQIEAVFQQAEDSVNAATETLPLILQTSSTNFFQWANAYADALLSNRPEQFNFYIAFDARTSRRLFGQRGMVYVVAKNPELSGTSEFNSPATFRRLTYTDTGYQNDSGELWYHGALQATGIHHTRLYYDTSYMRRVLFSITRAFRAPKTGTAPAVVGMDLTAGTFSRLLSRFELGKTGGAFVLDNRGRPLAPFMNRDIPMLGFRFDPGFETQPAFAETVDNPPPIEIRQGLQEVRGKDGKRYLLQVAALPGRPFSVVTYQEYREVYQTVFWSVGSIIVLGIVFLLVTFFFRQRLALFVITNINRILENIDSNRLALEQGDPGAVFNPLDPRGPRETSHLAAQLNLLYDRLQRAFREVQGERDRAAQATRSKSRFLSIMSHEIRTPLNAMLGLTDVLLTTPLEAEQAKNLQIIRRSGRALLRILNDILDFSRLEAGKLQIESHEFSLFELLHDVEGLLRFQAEQKGLRFLILAPEHDYLLEGDSVRVRQALLNLVGNAIKFTSEGSVSIQVDALPGDDPGQERFCFKIIDTGVGIPNEYQAQIFSDFSQGDASITRRFGGTGLGLGICKQIVDLLGGTMTFQSRAGIGSTFEFTLQFKVKSKREATYARFRPSTAEAVFIPTPSTLPPSQSASERLILVVDDDEDNHRLIDAFLKILPEVKADHVHSAAEALAQLERKPYALVLMDLQMPEMDGMRATQMIRLRQSSGRIAPCPVVMVSANTFPEDFQKSMAAGADEHVGKPLSLSQFRLLLTKYLFAHGN